MKNLPKLSAVQFLLLSLIGNRGMIEKELREILCDQGYRFPSLASLKKEMRRLVRKKWLTRSPMGKTIGVRKKLEYFYRRTDNGFGELVSTSHFFQKKF